MNSVIANKIVRRRAKRRQIVTIVVESILVLPLLLTIGLGYVTRFMSKVVLGLNIVIEKSVKFIRELHAVLIDRLSEID